MFPSEAEVERLLALPILPPSPLSPWSSPLPQIPSPSLHLPPQTVRLMPPMSPSIEARIAEYAAAPAPPSPPPSPLSPWLLPLSQIPLPPLPPPPSSLHLPLPIPTSLPLPSSPLPLLPDSLYEMGESSTAAARPTGGHRVDYGFIGTTDAEIRRQRAKEVGYGIRDVWVDLTEAVEESVDGLVEDRHSYYETARLLDQEALVSREAWAHSVGLSLAVSSLQGQLSNNMPLRRSSATARAAATTAARAVAAATPMTAAAVEQLIKERVSAALANHETL
ncbi:hypothetical protein Tco_1441449, partial [Tanacetum coccineum]